MLSDTKPDIFLLNVSFDLNSLAFERAYILIAQNRHRIEADEISMSDLQGKATCYLVYCSSQVLFVRERDSQQLSMFLERTGQLKELSPNPSAPQRAGPFVDFNTPKKLLVSDYFRFSQDL